MTLAGYNLQDNVYIYSNNKCMCVFLISPVPIAVPLTSELIDTPVFYNLAPRPIKYRVSVPIPTYGPQAVQYVDEFVSSSELIWKKVALHNLFNNGFSAVNMCRQNESPNSEKTHVCVKQIHN